MDSFALITFENGVKAIVEVGTSNYTQLPRWYIKELKELLRSKIGR